MAKFTVTYDDFSGGLWVGGRSRAKQPKNTYEGVDLIPEPGSGYLMPTGGWTAHTSYSYLPPLIADLTYAWYIDPIGSNVGYFAYPDGAPTDITSADPPAGDPVLFDGKFVTPALSLSELLVAAVGDVSATVVTTPDELYALCVYDAWVLGAASTQPNRIYYCDAYDPTTWQSASYYDVGSVTEHITAMVPHNGALYIATFGGWYIANGIPGETFSIHKLNSHSTELNTKAVDADLRIMYTAPARSWLNELSGIIVSPAGYPVVYPVGGPVRWGPFVVVADTDATYFYDILTRTWFAMSQLSSGMMPCPAPTATGLTLFVVDGDDVYEREILPGDCGFASSAFVQSTALLADYMHKSEFRVTEVVAEVEMDTNSSTADRSIAVKVLTPGHPDMALASASAAATTEQTYTWNVAGTQQVAVVRFNINDHPPTYLAQPQVKLKGVKLRRLILRCTES